MAAEEEVCTRGDRPPAKQIWGAEREPCVCLRSLGTRRPSYGGERGEKPGHRPGGAHAGVCHQPSRTRRGKVELESSCAPVPSLIGESHAASGRIRYRHQILNEIVPHKDAAPFFFWLSFSIYFLLEGTPSVTGLH